MILIDNGPPEKRRDTCNGDSGGPVLDTTSGRATLIGVTSRALPVGGTTLMANAEGAASMN